MKTPDFSSNFQKKAQNGLQAAGKQIRKNISQGQKDLKSGKVGRYGTINPLSGTKTAFIKGFKLK